MTPNMEKGLHIRLVGLLENWGNYVPTHGEGVTHYVCRFSGVVGGRLTPNYLPHSYEWAEDVIGLVSQSQAKGFPILGNVVKGKDIAVNAKSMKRPMEQGGKRLQLIVMCRFGVGLGSSGEVLRICSCY